MDEMEVKKVLEVNCRMLHRSRIPNKIGLRPYDAAGVLAAVVEAVGAVLWFALVRSIS